MAVWILILEAFAVYGLVLGAHALRHRFGLAHFYALLGGITAVMSWVTDAGVLVQLAGVSFLVGSTVFYTSILLGVFVVYVFDGPRATRIAISTVVGVSIMVPLIALALHLQMKLMGSAPLGYVPVPSLRINTASVLATLMDLIFLAVAWEFFNTRLNRLHPALRAFLTLLGVMWLDVVLFNAGAFAGRPGFMSTLTGTLISRALVCLFALPLLWLYLAWQNRIRGIQPTQRPLLAILHKITRMEEELDLANQEIYRRKETERKLRLSEERLALALEAGGVGVYDYGLPLEGEMYFSDRWLTLHGLNRADVGSTEGFMENLEKLLHPDDFKRFLEVYQGLDSGGLSEYEIEYRVREAEGGWAEMLTYAKAVPTGSGGKKARVVGVALDITGRKQAQRSEQERAKLQGAMEMAGAACHELNQPLQILFGNTELLAEDLSDGPEVAGRLRTILDQLLRMQEITQKIQGITRYETKSYGDRSRIIDIHKSSAGD